MRSLLRVFRFHFCVKNHLGGAKIETRKLISQKCSKIRLTGWSHKIFSCMRRNFPCLWRCLCTQNMVLPEGRRPRELCVRLEMTNFKSTSYERVLKKNMITWSRCTKYISQIFKAGKVPSLHAEIPIEQYPRKTRIICESSDLEMGRNFNCFPQSISGQKYLATA